MKKIKQFFLFFLLAVCTFAFAACGEPTTYAVKFVNDDDSVLLELTLEEGETPEYTGETPEKEATAQYTYTFVGWDKVIAPATEDVTYKATYTQTVNKYTVKFVDEDGTLLEEKQWDYGATPSYTGETPTKEATAQYTYTFGGWDSEIATVTGDATYTATYTDVTNKYKATFYDLEGGVLYETSVDYGETPVYGGETPTLEGDVQYYYVFTGWTTELAPITEDTSYRPKFERHVHEYTVKFVDAEGNTLQESKIAYGTLPVFEGTLPLPEDTAQYDYTGAWNMEIVEVTGDITYTYIVTGAIRQYDVKFVNEDGTVLSSGRYDYGTEVTFDGTPYKAATAEYIYTFKGWDSEVVAVAGDAIYTAQYAQVENTYEVVIGHATIDGYVAIGAATQNLTEKKLYDYTAPAVAGLTASHETLKYYYDGEKVLITVYYSEIDVWDGESVSTAFVGEGTEANPYLIASGADLALLRANVNAGNTYAGAYFKMVKSIDLNSVSLMIGTSESVSFGGNFDGNNCAIKNIATKESIQSSGLFQTLPAGGKVSNLSTYGAYNQTAKFNGVVVGRNYGTVENVTNYASITPVDEEKPGEVSRYTGSIASYNHGSIISCVNYGYIFGEQYASGIAARQVGEAAKIENCINYSNIRGGGFKPAGIVGHAEAGVISGCINYGAEVRGSQYAAGIVAVADAATVSDCVNYAAVVQLSSETAGGIVGMTAAAVSNCFNYGSVSALKYVGGIAGIAKAAVSGCTNNGAVTSTGDRTGGIVGNLSATGSINNCNNYGAVSAAGRYDVGGIAGGAEGNVENSNNYGEISAKQKLGGIVGAGYANITNCTNEGNVTGTADFVGGIVGASNGTSRTISGCTNNGTISGSNYIGGIDGRPYAGELIITNCTNNGALIAKGNYAGGIVGRTDVCHATLNGCSSNGSITAKYPGYMISLNTTSETTGYSIENCTTTLKNIYEIGYDSTTKAPAGNIYRTFTVTFVDEKGEVLQSGTVDEGVVPVFTGTLPTLPENTDYCTYSGAWDKEIVAATAETTYTYIITATYAKYAVKFYHEDGTTLLYETQVEWGQVPVYAGEEPTKEATSENSYLFIGWTPEIAAITGETTYKAVFEARANKYLVKFVDEEGNVLQSGEIAFGEVPVFTGTLPLPEDTAQYDYTGAWDKEIVEVTGEATYTYIVTKTVKSYEVKFVNDDGKVLFAQVYEYGTTPEFDRIPYKAATAEYIYTFKGWDNEVVAVVADATYTAVYDKVENTYELVVGHATVDGYLASAVATQTVAENGLYTYTAPTVAGMTASHEYVKYYYEGKKILLTVYYSEIDVWDGESVSTAFVGEGTAENPYLIASGADLALLRANVNAGNTYAGAYFKMVKSIDLNNVSLMIGTSDTVSFGGNFDGNNCAIKNIATKESIQFSGLFKTILAGGKVSNFSTYGAYSQSIKFNGVIVGRNYGTVENVTNYASITVPEGTSVAEVHRYTGSIASYNNGSLIGCVNYGAISGEQYASGIVARQEAGGKLEGCINYGSVNGTWRSAGIVGYAAAGTVTGCVNYGALTSPSSQIGGIVGESCVPITYCVNYGTITGSSADGYGGIAGKTTAAAPVSNCVNYGNISVAGRYDVGGIVGQSNASITDCQNYGNISAKQKLGGIAGFCYVDIYNCTNAGKITGTADFVGGIVGASYGTSRTISGCVNNGAVKGVNYIGGIDGRPYGGVLNFDGCVNTGKITATGNYAGGVAGSIGRSNTADNYVTATFINCQSNGEVVAVYPGVFVGEFNNTPSTCDIQDSCTTTLKNIYYIGYDSATGRPGGGIDRTYPDAEELDVLSGGFYGETGSVKTFTTGNIAIIKDLTLTEGEFSLLSRPVSTAKSGVIFGYSNEGGTESYYRFVTSDDSNLIYLDKVVNGTVTNIQQHFASVNASTTYEYRIVIEDGKAYCYFWADRLWAVIDLELTGTGVGLFAEGAETEFKNYAVTADTTHTTVDTLIIGHSYMDFWSTYREDLSEVVEEYDLGEYLNIGNGGSRANHWLALQESVAAYEADLLIYMIGINDISGNIAPTTIVTNIENTLTYLKGVNPDLKVILFAVNHTTNKVDFATTISQTNDLMEALCANYDWIFFADTEYAFCDDGVNPTAAWFTDGLHITAAAYQEKIVPAIADACDRIAQQASTSYTIKFVDEDGNILQEETLQYGEMPVFTGTLPQLPANTDYCTYTGAWDKEIKFAAANATYTYVITATYETYTIKFLGEDGDLLYETKVEWGQMPIYNGVTPSKQSTAQYVYQFAGWTPELAVVSGDADYTATFTAIETEFDVIINHLNLDGTEAVAAYTAELTEEKLYTYTAPVIEGKVASHEYVNYYFDGEKVLLTIYYSEVDVWDGASVSSSFVGEGSAENPYLIQSGADLALLRVDVNGGNTYANTYFKMTKSIDLNKKSLMIGTSEANSFAGIFEGNNCVILNIKTDETQTGQYAGLFKWLLAGGKISNLSTYGEYTQTIKMNGVLVGRNHGTIENVTNYVNIVIPEGTTPAEIHRYSAGFASVNYGSIISCTNYGNIAGEEYASGITSRQYAGSKIENCVNYGTVKGKGFRCAGIVGYAEGGELTACANFGNVSTGATSNDIKVGGISGESLITISNCVNYGEISNLANKSYVGGIVGFAQLSRVENCINYGVVKGYQYVGGIAGYASGVLYGNTNNGTVSGQQWIGGIVGRSTVDLTNNTNNASVTGTADFVGGIVGASDGSTGRTISGCVNNGAVKGVGYIGGIDGRPYAGNVIYRDCTNTGTVTATLTGTDLSRGSAGGIVGRTDVAYATLINCQSNGAVTALSAGAYVGLNSTTETTGYVIYDSCSTTLTGNAIGYDKTLAAGIPLEGFTYTQTAE